MQSGDWSSELIADKMSDPNVFTVTDLREKLRARGLTTAGTKNDLITCLMESDPSGTWMAERDENADSAEDKCADEREDALRRREMDFYRRQKELAERELELARDCDVA